MSRRALRKVSNGMPKSIQLGLVLLILSPTQLSAQQQASVTAAEVIEDAKLAYGPPAPEPKCDQQSSDEILVCGEIQEQSQFRVKSSTELDPESEEAINDGLPRAPDVAGPGIFHGAPTIGGLCIPGLQKCPPPPALIIDFSQLPEAPSGSDADRIARGLPPIGNDGSAINPAEPSPVVPETGLENSE